MQEIQARKQWNPSLENDVPSLGSLIEALQWLAVSQIASVGLQLQEEISSGKSPEVAWNDNMMQAVSASRYNCPYRHYQMLFTYFHIYIHTKCFIDIGYTLGILLPTAFIRRFKQQKTKVTIYPCQVLIDVFTVSRFDLCTNGPSLAIDEKVRE